MTNPTLERAARVLAEHFGCEWDTMRDADRETIRGYCRAVLMAVLPTGELINDDFVFARRLQAILNDGEGE